MKYLSVILDWTGRAGWVLERTSRGPLSSTARASGGLICYCANGFSLSRRASASLAISVSNNCSAVTLFSI